MAPPFPVGIKRESAGHTQLHDLTKAHSSTLLVLEKEIQWRHLIFVLRSAQTFVLLTRLAMSLYTVGTIFSHHACDLNSGASNRP